MKQVTRILFTSLLMIVFGSVALVEATSFTLVDDNSSAYIDTENGGMLDWIVDGTDQLFQQWFWLGVGSGDQRTQEYALDELDVVVEGVSDTNFDNDDDTLFVKYAGGFLGDFTVEVRYVLDGGSEGSLQSDIAEQITITNTGQNETDFHFFQYSDFDLGGDWSDDMATLRFPNTVTQYDDDTVLAETVVTPQPNHWQIAPCGETWAGLNDDVATDLYDATSPLSGDMTWAFQWDFTLAAGGTFQISKDKNIDPVPEPGTVLLLGAGLLGLIGLGRKRIKK